MIVILERFLNKAHLTMKMTQTLDNKVRILLLENEPNQIRAYTDNIQLKCGLGIEVEPVATVEEAKKRIDSNGSSYYSLVIIDQRVDDSLTGSDLAVYLRSKGETGSGKNGIRYRSPIIIASGSPIRDIQERLLSQKIIDVNYWQKGSDWVALIKDVNQLLNRELLQRLDSALSAVIFSSFLEQKQDRIDGLKHLSQEGIKLYNGIKEQYDLFVKPDTTPDAIMEKYVETVKSIGKCLWPLLSKVQENASALVDMLEGEDKKYLSLVVDGADNAEKLLDAAYSRFELLEECTYTVLFLDDQQENRTLLQRALQGREFNYHGKKIKFKVVSAATHEEAVSYLQVNDVDFFLTDMKMPNVTGIEVLDMVGKKGDDGRYTPHSQFKLPSGRAALYTTLTSTEDERKAEELGVPYLHKPMDPNNLQKKICDLIEQNP